MTFRIKSLLRRWAPALSTSLLAASGYALASDVQPAPHYGLDVPAREAAFQAEPVEPEQPVEPETPDTTPQADFSFAALDTSAFGGLGAASTEGVVNTESRVETASAGEPASVALGGDPVLVRAARDVGTILQESPAVTSIATFRRPILTDPRIRGYNSYQIHSQLNGALWKSARPDLDTIISKIDAGIVDDVIIIQGPYSAIYGPSLAFIDVVTAPTLRSCCGDVVQFRTNWNWDENGDSIYLREVADLGGANWGARFNWGWRQGNDYESGNGTSILASYKSLDAEYTYSYDFANGATMEFQFLHHHLKDVQLHNQPMDIDDSITHGYTLRYVNDYSSLADRVTVEGWYNQTDVSFDGLVDSTFTITTGPPTSLVNAPIFLDLSQDAEVATSGIRSAFTYGCPQGDYTTLGADVRYVRQDLREEDNFLADGINLNQPAVVTGLPPDAPFDVPNADQYNPGAFVQRQIVVNDRLTMKVGGRLDFVRTELGQLRDDSFSPGPVTDRNFTLVSGFVTSEYYLRDGVSLTFGVGHGQRAPSLFELYADAPLTAGNQAGFTFFQGNSQLQEERATQIDLGFQTDLCNARYAVRGYHSWVDNYITYDFIGLGDNDIEGPIIPLPLSQGEFFALVGNLNYGYQFVNSDSTLSGVEFNGEYDLSDSWSVFGQLSYTRGQDQDRFPGPVFGIYPLQSRVGIRVERGDRCRGYGLEFSSRLVDDQDRVATAETRGITAQPGLGRLATQAQRAAAAEEEPTPGFVTFDLRGYLRLRENILLTGGVANLGDLNYFEHFDYRKDPLLNGTPTFQPGRNFYAGGEVTY